MTRDTWRTIGEWCALALALAACGLLGLALVATALGQDYAPQGAGGGHALTNPDSRERPALVSRGDAQEAEHGQEHGERVRAPAEGAKPAQLVQARTDQEGNRGAAGYDGRQANRGAPPEAAPDAGEEALTLARCVVGEGGWKSARDHAAVLHVLDRRARASGRTLLDQALAYAAGCDAARVTLERPRQAADWAAAVATVEAFLAGALPDPCRGRADHWGGTAKGTERDQANIAARVADGTSAVVDCGPTRNTFTRTLARPRP
jgi:hypothetical protein